MVRGDAGRRRETRRQLGCGCGRAHGARGQVSVPREPHGARPGAGAAAVARAWAHNGHSRSGKRWWGTTAAASQPSMTSEESVTTSDGGGGREALEPPNLFV
jgi:hypothetical protein